MFSHNFQVSNMFQHIPTFRHGCAKYLRPFKYLTHLSWLTPSNVGISIINPPPNHHFYGWDSNHQKLIKIGINIALLYPHYSETVTATWWQPLWRRLGRLGPGELSPEPAVPPSQRPRTSWLICIALAFIHTSHSIPFCSTQSSPFQSIPVHTYMIWYD